MMSYYWFNVWVYSKTRSSCCEYSPRAAATSPSGWARRRNAVGAMPMGNGTRCPSSDVSMLHRGTARRTRGTIWYLQTT